MTPDTDPRTAPDADSDTDAVADSAVPVPAAGDAADAGDAAAGHTAAAAARQLAVLHETRYQYDTPVEVAHHSAWLRPRDTDRQRVLDWRLDIDPKPETAVQQSRDVYGNWRHGFSHAQVHAQLRVRSRFVVELRPVPEPDPELSPPWTEVASLLQYRAGKQQPDAVSFVLGSPYAPEHRVLADFGAEALGPCDQPQPLLRAALQLMDLVYRRMRYRPNSTDVATDALQALAQRQGVCQDFAHLMIGALRSWGLAARYVSGYLLTQPPPGRPRLVGADASHAWVEVWCPRQGWLALDPTNNLVVGCDHVTLAWGRDYADVAPLRGVIRGGGSVPPAVAVTVAPPRELPAELAREFRRDGLLA